MKQNHFFPKQTERFRFERFVLEYGQIAVCPNEVFTCVLSVRATGEVTSVDDSTCDRCRNRRDDKTNKYDDVSVSLYFVVANFAFCDWRRCKRKSTTAATCYAVSE